jgi:chromosomal replication initiator protein
MKLSDYTFETFVVTPPNRLAYLAAQKICESPGAYNPLYIFGPSGTGKTHLLHAIAKEYQNKQKTVLCVSANQFLDEMIEAIKTGTNIELKEKYHQADVLLINRLQYISEKGASQEELFNIVDRRILENKQVVVVGDNPLGRIPDLRMELQACLSGGLCIEIQTPDLDTKTKIISVKLKNNGVEWPMDACRYVALNISSGIKQIEGEINRILAFRELL